MHYYFVFDTFIVGTTVKHTCFPQGEYALTCRLIIYFGLSLLFSSVDCPKIDKNARQVAGGHKDALVSGGGYGGDW